MTFDHTPHSHPSLGAPVLPQAPVHVATRGAAVGRYVLLRRIGEGGIGEVYAAHDPELDREVAIKLLRPRGRDTRAVELRERLFREAQAMARVSHPNVIPIYDVGVSEGRVFLTMELVQGQTLRHWRHSAAPDWRGILQAYMAAGRGLSAAHAAGIVHRDFKPDNVLVAADGCVKVMDFGIARALESLAAASASSAGRLVAADDATGSMRMEASATVELPVGYVEAATDSHGHHGDGEPPMLPAATDDEDGASSRPPPSSEARGPVDSKHRSRPSFLAVPLTSEGTIMGTPGYMAPEQYRAEPPDPRTDQFAFSVALYEALYGERPFGGDGFAEVQAAVLEGRLRPAPRGSRVPPWVRRVVVRGLSPTREGRYPSMDAMLEALSADPWRRWRRIVLLGAAVVTVSGSAVVAGRQVAASRAMLCTGGAERVAEVWGPEVRGAVNQSFLATGKAYARSAFSQAAAALDAYGTKWAAMHQRACEATRVRGEQSEQVMTQRMTCLEQRRREMGALVRVFRDADGDVVERAAQAARSLPSLQPCADVSSLASATPPPDDAAVRARIDGAREELAAATAEQNAGKVRAAEERVKRVVERARQIGFEPLEAEAMLAMGAVETSAGEYAAAARAYKESLWAAERGRADGEKAEAALGLAFALGELGTFSEAHDYARLAEATASRIGSSGITELRGLSTEGWIFFREGNYTEAVSLLARAVAQAERSDAPNPEEVGLLENRLASSLLHLRRTDEALALLQKEERLIVSSLGEEHPARIHNLIDTSAALLEVARYAEAAALLERALTLEGKAALGKGTAYIFTLNNLGEAYEGLERTEDALSRYDAALAAAKAAYGDGHWIVGAVSVSRGRTLVALGREREGLGLCEEGLRVEEATLPSNHDLLGDALACVGRGRLALCRPQDAVAPLARAAGLLTRDGTAMKGAMARLALAEALHASGDRSGRPEELRKQARETFLQAGATDRAEEAERPLSRAPRCGPNGRRRSKKP